jgi:dihydrofolate reductase
MNIVLSSLQDGVSNSVITLPDVRSVLTLARSLTRDLYVIGGAKVYGAFLAHIDRWIVTEVPLSVEDADTFMPANFLDGFELSEVRQLEEGLRVKFYERVSEARP